MRDLENRDVDLIVDRPFDATATTAICYRGTFAAAFVELTHALRHRTGYVVVTGERAVGKSTFVQSVLADFDAFAVVTVSAVNQHPCYALEKLVLSRGTLTRDASMTEKRAELFSMVEQARLAGKPIVLVVEDADWADAAQLHDLWTALVVDRRIDEMVQVVLVGSPDLEAKLCKRSARALAERVSTRVHLRIAGDARRDRNADVPRGRLAAAWRSARRALGRATPPVAALLLLVTSGAPGGPGGLERFDASVAQASDAPATSRLVDGRGDACRGLGPAFSGICGHLEHERRANGGLVEPSSGDDGDGPGAPAAAPGSAGARRPSDDQHVQPAGDEHAPAPSEEPARRPAPLRRPYPTVLSALQPDVPLATHSHAKTGKLVIDWPSHRGMPSNALAMARFEAATVRDDEPAAVAPPATFELPEHQIALHVAEFRSLAPSLVLKSRLARDYDHVYVRKVEDAEGALYRVRIGRFASVAASAPVAARLRADGYVTHPATEE